MQKAKVLCIVVSLKFYIYMKTFQGFEMARSELHVPQVSVTFQLVKPISL